MTPEDDAEYRANTAAALRHLADLLEAPNSTVSGVGLCWMDHGRTGGSLYLTFANTDERDAWVLIGQLTQAANHLCRQIQDNVATPISVLNPKAQS